MKFTVEKSYMFYTFLKNIFSLVVLSSLLLVLYFFEFNKWFKVALATIIVIVVLKTIFDLMLFKRYKKNNYIIFEDSKLTQYENTLFTINFSEIIIPTKNILHYSIEQNILLKKFNLYRANISSGVSIESFYFNEKNVEYVESFLKHHIIKNSVLKETEEV